MKKNFKKNPNTVKYWNDFYKVRRVSMERKNEWVIPMLNFYIKGVRSVLEVGCGMGMFIREMSKKYKGLYYLGTDHSEVAIKRAQKSQTKKMQFDLWDVHRPFPFGAKFDLVMCIQSMEHMDNPEVATKNMVDACNVGGKVFITVPYPGSPLDVNKNNLHHWTLYPEDFKKWIDGDVKIFHEDRNHMVVVGSLIKVDN